MTDKRRFGGRYEVRGQIASGGMAEVFHARDMLLERDVALKTLHTQFAKDRSFLERFRREAQAAASLNDPRIVSIFDYGPDDGSYYIVMEYVEGRTLREVISEEGPLTPERAAEIAAEVCGALQIAHGKGIVHRDIKPANIAITGGGQTKVMDFGIARATANDDSKTMTQTGVVIGTANYLSPEQAQGMAVDARSDIYSLGVVLYEMLTNEVPFKADTAVAIAYKHVKEEPVPPSRLNGEVPPGLDAIVMKALAKNPDNRYQSASEMRFDIQRFLRGEKPVATPILPPDQTAMFEPSDRTTVMPVPTTSEGSNRRKAIAYLLIFFLFMSLLALGVLGLLQLFGGRAETVDVPDVVNLPVEEAERILEREGLQGKVTAREPSLSIAEGRVISQDPAEGRKAPEGSEVKLTISTGPDKAEIPDLIGKTLEEAENLLDDAGLKLGATPTQFSDKVEEGRIMSQDPRAGEKVDPGSSVDVVVSAGRETVRVPAVEGISEESARERLLDAGLVPKVVEACNTSEPDSRVLKQDPPPQQTVPKGSEVTLTVNRAPRIPVVEGQSEASATKELEDAGFKVELIKFDKKPGKQDNVDDQTPEAGERACKGDTVTISVEE